MQTLVSLFRRYLGVAAVLILVGLVTGCSENNPFATPTPVPPTVTQTFTVTVTVTPTVTHTPTPVVPTATIRTVPTKPAAAAPAAPAPAKPVAAAPPVNVAATVLAVFTQVAPPPPAPAKPAAVTAPIATSTPLPVIPTSKRSTAAVNWADPNVCDAASAQMGYNQFKPHPLQTGSGNYVDMACKLRAQDRRDQLGDPIVVPENMVLHGWIDYDTGKKIAVTVVGPAIIDNGRFLLAEGTIYNKVGAQYKTGREGKWTYAELTGLDNGNDCEWVNTDTLPPFVAVSDPNTYPKTCSAQKALFARGPVIR